MRSAAAFRQWLFRLARDETLPIILRQRRIFIVPSAGGLLYALTLVVMLLGAINYELSLGHALVFLLAGIGLVAMVHTFRNLLGLRLTPGRAEPVFAGGIARFPLHVESPTGPARRALEFAFAGVKPVTLDLDSGATGHGATASVLLPCPAPRRGRLDPGRITLTTRYPLGLFRAWSYLQPVLSCVVYPQPLETPLPASAGAARAHSRAAVAGATGDEDFNGLRRHHPNDSPRHIAWKALARDSEHAPLLVKQFGGEAADELWLDWTATPADAALETRLSLLAGWVVAAARASLRYGLRLPDRRIAPDSGAAHREVCLEALALHGEI